ncbi:hypothetical protein BWI97_03100 [Siphonobacter sp. BAB-5405]|uniref:hypothetical protein n=1 Tax=Siphonobacter sp. BAB-5405 TaxID=1864825 RepID=UPI000C7FF888|nr:hypothetical protein [Siphonobacter sp. BAB-5405]PMD98815.1 hypothetical protein BWI97_03100 [Siphonobacter sp. BAB-5405]
MYKLFTPIFFLISVLSASAQMGIGTSTPDPSAALDITSTDKGLLIPRVTLADRPGSPGKAAPTLGLMVFQTDNDPGFYVYDGTSWDKMVKKSEVAPSGFAYAVRPLDGPTVYYANHADAYPVIKLSTYASSPDITLSEDNFKLLIARGGTYSIEYSVEPINVGGNQYSVNIVCNGVSDSDGSGVSITGNPKTQGRTVKTLPANSTVELRFGSLTAPGRIDPSVMFFNQYRSGVFLKVTRVL